jgi:PIN like domain
LAAFTAGLICVSSIEVERNEIYERAEQRIQLSIPPGFGDAAQKKDYHRYGDVVLWLQMLDYAKASQKTLIFVTSDSKEDWWRRQSGKTVGPRQELIQEMHVAAGVGFHMYTPATFIEHAAKSLELQTESAKIKVAAKELRDIEARKAAFAGTGLDWNLMRPENPVAVYLQKGLQDSLGALGNQELLKVIENSRSPLEKLLAGQPLLSIDPMTKVFSDLFIKPEQFTAALEYATNTPIARLNASIAYLGKALESDTNPLGLLYKAAKIAGQSQTKAESDGSAHADAQPGELKSPDATQPNEKDKPSGDGEK